MGNQISRDKAIFFEILIMQNIYEKKIITDIRAQSSSIFKNHEKSPNFRES